MSNLKQGEVLNLEGARALQLFFQNNPKLLDDERAQIIVSDTGEACRLVFGGHERTLQAVSGKDRLALVIDSFRFAVSAEVVALMDELARAREVEELDRPEYMVGVWDPTKSDVVSRPNVDDVSVQFKDVECMHDVFMSMLRQEGFNDPDWISNIFLEEYASLKVALSDWISRQLNPQVSIVGGHVDDSGVGFPIRKPILMVFLPTLDLRFYLIYRYRDNWRCTVESNVNVDGLGQYVEWKEIPEFEARGISVYQTYRDGVCNFSFYIGRGISSALTKISSVVEKKLGKIS